jgi:hypothetical protein
MRIKSPTGAEWTLVLGASWELAKEAGAIDWMSACHSGFKTEGLAIGYIKRLIKTWGSKDEIFWVPSIPCQDGRIVFGVYIA